MAVHPTQQSRMAALFAGLLVACLCGSVYGITMDERLRALAGRYNGQATTFMANGMGQQASGFGGAVVFDACGRPLCPPAVTPGPPPPAYVCDCTSIAPHPDCGCNSLSSCDCNNPACPCNRGPIVGQNFPFISDAAPLGAINPNHHVRYFTNNLYDPATPEKNLPSMRDDECRPNVATVGPGTCRKQPTNLGCTSQFSNCLQPPAQQTAALPQQQQNMLKECAKKGIQPKDCVAPATQLRCPCKSAAPAPCVCKQNGNTGIFEDIGEDEDYETEQQLLKKNKQILANMELSSADDLDKAFAKDLQDDCTLKQDGCVSTTGRLSALDQATAILASQHSDLKQDIDKFARVFKAMSQKATQLNDPVLQAALSSVKSSGAVASHAEQPTPAQQAAAAEAAAAAQPPDTRQPLMQLPQKGPKITHNFKFAQQQSAPTPIGAPMQAADLVRFRETEHKMVPAVVSDRAEDLVPQGVEILAA